MAENSINAHMSDEEAKKEHEDIQREIAKGKGLTAAIDDPKDDKDGEEKEPVSKEEKAPDAPEPKDSEEGKDEEDDVVVPPTRTDRRIPLAKYQELKKELRETTEAKDGEIVQLRKDLEAAKSNKEIGSVVKEFAEKHNVSEEFAKDMLDMAKAAMPKSDPSREAVISKAEVFIKKQEANEAFENEFSTLLKDVPDAADLKAKIRLEAFKESNLDKSLFEVFHRFVKPTLNADDAPPAKRGAEVTRGPSSTRNGPPAFDPKRVAEDIKNNVPGAMSKLSDKQVDEVFDYMEKNGSRYL